MAIHVSSHDKGFSLLEVMITAVILSLGLLGLVACNPFQICQL
ncbi:prepilin-type N-terminal cleavage/methylation domain-containing protein [Aeromonas sp. A-5]